MEVDLQLVEHKTGQRTQTQREDDLHQRLHDDAERVDAALLQRVRHAERGREEDEADGVVDGDHHQQQMGQRAVGLVLLDDHQGRGRGRGRCDRTQRDGRGHGDDIRAEQVQDDQCEIHQRGGDDGLQDADRDGLPAHVFQRGQTKFVADDESSMYIEVYPITEDTVDFDEEYSKRKDSFSSYTLINAEKLPESNGTQHMHFQAKNKEQIIDLHEYYAKNYKYLVLSMIKINDDTSTKDMILSLVDSFKIGKIDNETYDLSTVKTEGTRKYREITDDTYKVSFYVPANYQMEDDNTENEFTFYEPKNESTSHISLGIYSKTGDTTAYSLATHDHAIREKYASTKYSTLTPVSETGTNSYKYTQTISGSTDSDLYTVDTFFEKGDYVYNFAITTNLDYDEMELNTILNSIKAEELDSSKIGKLMRNDPEDTLNTAKVGDYQFSIPASWKLFSKASQGSSYTNVSYVNTYTTSGIIYASMTGSDFKQTNLSTVANSYSKSITQDDEHEMFKKVEYTSINGKRYAYFTYTTTSKADYKSYGTVYMTCDNGTAHIFTLIQDEVFYGSAEIDDFIDIVNSFQSK